MNINAEYSNPVMYCEYSSIYLAAVERILIARTPRSLRKGRSKRTSKKRIKTETG